MKVLAIVALFAAAPGLIQCPDKKPASMPVSEACEVLNRTLYPNCRLRFTPSEIEALSEENQTKLA